MEQFVPNLLVLVVSLAYTISMHLLEPQKPRERAIHEIKFRRFVFDEFQKAKAKNPSYSLRSYSKKLGVPVSALSEIFQGKRAISLRTAEKIMARFSGDPEQRAELLAPFLDSAESSRPDPAVVRLEMDQFRMISDWFHFGILSLAETDDFNPEISSIAQRLGLSEKTVDEAVERLLRLGMLIRETDGSLKASGISYSSPDGVASSSIRRGHENNLELAKVSLEKDSIESRDFTAVTMAIDPSKLPEARRRIRKFQNELCDFLESGVRSEVFKVCTQLFPLTNFKYENEGEAK